MKKLNTIAISNNNEKCQILSNSGVDQIMIDCESIGKLDRQKGKNAVFNSHNINDILNIERSKIRSKFICRINPYNKFTFKEIDQVVDCNYDYIMLPMINNLENYFKIIKYIDKRIKVIPLIETSFSLIFLNYILHEDIDQVHFGLNDLSISFGTKNIFQILLSKIFINAIKESKKKCKIVGIGGIGLPENNNDKINPLDLIFEYKRIGSNSVILSRSFFIEGYNSSKIKYSINKLNRVEYSKENYISKKLLNQINDF